MEWDIIRYRRIGANYLKVRCENFRNFGFKEGRSFEPEEELAHVVVNHLKNVERLDNMIMAKEARRNVAYRELERHRSGLGARLRAAITDVEDVEFQQIDGDATEQKRAA